MTIEKLNAAMDSVDEQNKASKITVGGGKKYTQVVTRVEVLRRHFGLDVGITTDIREFMGGVLVHACVVNKEGNSIGEGHAHTTTLNKDKCLEKTETTAIGRALAACGLAGGEYATQNELDTYEERYEEKAYEATEDESRLIADITHLIHCGDGEHVIASIFEEYAEEMGNFGDPSCHDPINEECEQMKKVWANGKVAQSLKYNLGNIEQSLKTFKQLGKDIYGMNSAGSLEDYGYRWVHKIKALDNSQLNAGKHKEKGLTPYERITKLYNSKEEELNKGED